jgi:hypothetical protein
MSEPVRKIDDDSVELLMFAEGLILVDSCEVLLTSAITLGQAETPTTVVLQFSGRVNHSDERRTVNVALDPKGAFDHAGSILDVIERAIQHDEGEDR